MTSWPSLARISAARSALQATSIPQRRTKPGFIPTIVRQSLDLRQARATGWPVRTRARPSLPSAIAVAERRTPGIARAFYVGVGSRSDFLIEGSWSSREYSSSHHTGDFPGPGSLPAAFSSRPHVSTSTIAHTAESSARLEPESRTQEPHQRSSPSVPSANQFPPSVSRTASNAGLIRASGYRFKKTSWLFGTFQYSCTLPAATRPNGRSNATSRASAASACATEGAARTLMSKRYRIVAVVAPARSRSSRYQSSAASTRVW